MILGQLVWARSKKDPVLQISGICALVAVCCFLLKRGQPHCCKPFSLQLKWPPGDVNAWCPSPRPLVFHLSPSWEPEIKDENIQKQLHLEKKNYSVTTHPQGKAQKRPKNTLNLYLGLFLCTETAYNNSNKNPNSKQKQKWKTVEHWGSNFQKNLISRVITLFNSNVQWSKNA